MNKYKLATQNLKNIKNEKKLNMAKKELVIVNSAGEVVAAQRAENRLPIPNEAIVSSCAPAQPGVGPSIPILLKWLLHNLDEKLAHRFSEVEAAVHRNFVVISFSTNTEYEATVQDGERIRNRINVTLRPISRLGDNAIDGLVFVQFAQIIQDCEVKKTTLEITPAAGENFCDSEKSASPWTKEAQTELRERVRTLPNGAMFPNRSESEAVAAQRRKAGCLSQKRLAYPYALQPSMLI